MSIAVRAAGEDDLPVFFAYLNDHLSDNGSGATALFMPMARADSVFPSERQDSFRQACARRPGEPGWRKLWLAWSADGEIAGHVDLRARRDAASAHRALLGMGVHRAQRQQGLGRRLIDTACAWALAATGIEWIDLDVISTNIPARRLYERSGFVQTGEIADLFRIDGASIGHAAMSRRLR